MKEDFRKNKVLSKKKKKIDDISNRKKLFLVMAPETIYVFTIYKSKRDMKETVADGITDFYYCKNNTKNSV